MVLISAEVKIISVDLYCLMNFMAGTLKPSLNAAIQG